MIRLLGLLVLVALTLPAQTLRVMSFNVRYPNPQDGENIWENRRELLVETIRKHDPDIFGTQEMFDLQGRYIVENLPQYEWFGLSRYGNHDNEHMGVFYKRDRYFVVESGNFWLSETPEIPASKSWDMSLARLVTWARFRDTDGREFYFYNTHFPHRAQDAAARLECAKVIVSDIRRRVPAFTKLIVVGDFNSGADTDAHAMMETELADSWKTAPTRSGPEGTFGSWVGKTDGPRIDWILYRGGWKALEARTITDHRDERYPSDHYPVFAVLTAP